MYMYTHSISGFEQIINKKKQQSCGSLNTLIHPEFRQKPTTGIRNTSPNAPVICIPGSPRARDSGATAGLKCWVLTSNESRPCQG